MTHHLRILATVALLRRLRCSPHHQAGWAAARPVLHLLRQMQQQQQQVASAVL
jgi:putative component of membrane protein insertase Oxa1/YidC/SpoIIIJ protein YidD